MLLGVAGLTPGDWTTVDENVAKASFRESLGPLGALHEIYAPQQQIVEVELLHEVFLFSFDRRIYSCF